MPTERQVKETVAQCVACMVFYVSYGKSQAVMNAMIAEIQETAHLIRRWGLSDSVINASLLCPIEDEIIARYGSVEGVNLYKEFAEVFNGVAMPTPAPTRCEPAGDIS